MSSMGRGRGVQVLEVLGDHSYRLHEEELKNILLRDDVKDLPVVVVSVAGSYRGGKSFILDFFLRYLNSPISTRSDRQWLGAEDEPLKGFSWRGGCDRETTGIHLWSEPLIATLNNTKVAVLLMDTQGTFDSSSSVQDCSTIFAVSTLISSVQIYNIKENIKEDDFQNLLLFTKYGKLAKAEGGKPFQVLKFLVRDWPYPYQLPYGISGGVKLLDKRLEINNTQTADMKELRQSIRSYFEHISGFLMPHPGFAVREENFDGRLSDISEEFKVALLELVPAIFGSSNLTPKMINGQRIKTRDLLDYFRTYTRIFNSRELPTPVSIYKATSEAALMSAERDAREQYESCMEASYGANTPSATKAALAMDHRRCCDNAIASFSAKKTMASQKDVDKKLKKLSKDLESRLKEFMSMNEGKVLKATINGKEKYKTYLAGVHENNLLCLHQKDVEIVHNEAVLEAMRVFDSQRKQFLNVKDEEREIFLKSFVSDLSLLKIENDKSNRLVVNDILNEYDTYMTGLFGKEPPLEEEAFATEHEKAYAHAVEVFAKKRNRNNDYFEDNYKSRMNEQILTKYTQMKSMNRSKNRRALMQSISFYDNYMKTFWDPEKCCLHPASLKSAHNTAKQSALQLLPQEGELTFETLLLTQMMDYKYKDLSELNDSANEAAVEAAFNLYKKKMEYDTSATGWWLLIVPMIVQLAKLSKYHETNKEAALLEFEKRRCGINTSYDPFYQKLIEKIENLYARY